MSLAAGDRRPTRMVLPLDSEIPAALIERPARYEEGHPWQEPYVSPLVDLPSARERDGWFHFCHGHHVEFLYWEATRLAARRARAAFIDEDLAEARRWLARVDRLIRGSGALLHYCGDLDPEIYDPCLRASMETARPDFSGDMSRDFLTMMDSKAGLVEVLTAGGAALEEDLRVFRQAERYWTRHHGEVISALHPGKSLLQDTVAAMMRESESFDFRAYVETVVRSEQALADYDAYFGVTRSSAMGLGDYWTQAVEKLATVHRSFELDAPTRSALMRGDAVVLAILSEALGDERRT